MSLNRSVRHVSTATDSQINQPAIRIRLQPKRFEGRGTSQRSA